MRCLQSLKMSRLTLSYAGDQISILPGVYNENATINVDLELYREGHVGECVFVSRFESCLLVEGCKVILKNIGLCVEEGALMHHALHIDGGEVDMDACEIFGGLYACFACSGSTLTANQSRFHSAYSFGVTCLNSNANLTDSFCFRNQEDGFNISGGTSKATFYRCRIADNKCHGIHVHDGAELEMDKTEVLRNGQCGICITGSDDQFLRAGVGETKFSSVKTKNSKVKSNDWNGIMVVDGSAQVCNVFHM